MEKELDNQKFELWIERKDLSPFVVSLFYFIEGPKMKHILGAGWSKQICIFKDKTIYFICKSDEIHGFHKIHANHLQSFTEEEVNKLMEKCLNVYSMADGYISEIANSSQDEFAINIKEYLRFVYEILMYTTTLPYFILMTVEDDTLNSKYKKIIKEACEKLRGDSKYSKVQEVFLSKLSYYLCEKFDIPKQSSLNFTYNEILQIIEKKSLDILDKEIDKREKLFMIQFNSPENDSLTYNTALIEQYLKEYVYLAEKDRTTELKGNIANKGYSKGRAVIVNTADDIYKVQEGDIIVSINTNPTIMPALVKCSAIVTDEGGISCHAAIVAREMNKPCIIATKIATKIIKDGDMVEVDANMGIVRII